MELSQTQEIPILQKSFETSDKALANEFKFVITNEVIDRGGDRILVDGLDTANYKANPVVFFNHNSFTLPIGKTTNLSTTNIGGVKSVVATVEFDENDDVARLIKNKVANGFLNATSVGIRVKEQAQVKTTEAEFLQYNLSYINQIQKSELLEFSIVTIPMNQTALALKGFTTQEMDVIEKAGRVLSQSNFAKLNDAYNSIGEVLNTATPQEGKAQTELINKEDTLMLDNNEPKNVDNSEDIVTLKSLEGKVAELSEKLNSKDETIETLVKSIREVNPLHSTPVEVTPENKVKNTLDLIAKSINAGGVDKAKANYPTLTKEFDTITNPQGGYLVSVPTSTTILPYLYPNSILNVAPVTRVPMSKRRMRMPIMGDLDNPTFVGKNATGIEVDGTLSEIELDVKYLRATAVISNDLIEESDYQIQSFITQQLALKAGVRIDHNFLYGTGASDTPTGIYTQVASANKYNATGTTLTTFRADITKAIKLVSNSLHTLNPNTTAFVMSDTQYFGILAFAESTGAEPSVVAELKNNRLYGFPIVRSNTVVSTEIWFGDWSKVFVGVYKDTSISFELNGTYQIGSTVYSGRDLRKSPLRLESELDFKLAYPKALSIIESSSIGA